jgi:predicted deacylase
MKVIDNLKLYVDPLGNEIKTPVTQVGKGAPHIVMVALQHGLEIIGLDTALQVLKNIRPKGTLTLISVASPQAFLDGTRLSGHYAGASAGLTTNMNRVHPGDQKGNFVDRSARAIDKYIHSLKPDLVIDLHSYAAQSVPHAIVDPCDGDLKNS